MAYTKQTWANGKAGGTPLSATRLNHIEDGIFAKAEQGPKGDTGDTGPQGEQGPKGTKGDTGAPGSDGADGFPTESQWNDLVARVTALENLA